MNKRFLVPGTIWTCLGAIAGLFYAGLVAYLMPIKFESEALVEITQDSVGMSGGPQTEELTIQTACKVMTSREVFERVIENLELVNFWNLGEQRCIERLQAITTVEVVEGTSLISIRVRDVDKMHARDIAEEIPASYSNYIKERSQWESERYLRELNRAVREQSDKVEERRKVLAMIAKSKKIGEGENLTNEDAIKRALHTQDYLDAKREFEMDMELLQALKLKQAAESINARAPADPLHMHSKPVIADVPIDRDVEGLIARGGIRGTWIGFLLAIPYILLRKPKAPKPPPIDKGSKKTPEEAEETISRGQEADW